MPSATQPAIVPDAPKSTSSGWATTTSARSTGLGALASRDAAELLAGGVERLLRGEPAPPPRIRPRMSGVSPPVVSSSPSSATAAVPPATFQRPATYSLVAPPEMPRLRAALFSITR